MTHFNVLRICYFCKKNSNLIQVSDPYKDLCVNCYKEKKDFIFTKKNEDEAIAVAFFKDMKELEEKYQKILDSGDFESCWDECVIIRNTLFNKKDYIDKV